jgi:hypothetical protein
VRRAGKSGEEALDVSHHGLGTGRVDLLVVVAREEGAAVLGVVGKENVVDGSAGLGLVGLGEDREPGWES